MRAYRVTELAAWLAAQTPASKPGVQGKHKCVEGSMQHDCAVCLEYLFNSTSPISVLRCGHTIHTHCLEVYVKNYHVNCPVCNFSFTTD